MSKKVNPNSKPTSTNNNTLTTLPPSTSSDEVISPEVKKMLEGNGSNWDETIDLKKHKVLTFKDDKINRNAPIIKSIKWGEIIYQNSAGSEISEKDVILYKQGGEFWNWKPLKKEKIPNFSHKPGYQKENIEYLLSKDKKVTHLILSTGWNDKVHFNGIKRDRLQKFDLNGVTPKGKDKFLIFILNTGDAAILYNTLAKDDKNHVILAMHTTC